jgi:hypothetical protein
MGPIAMSGINTNSPFQGSVQNILSKPNPGFKRVSKIGKQWITKLTPGKRNEGKRRKKAK